MRAIACLAVLGHHLFQRVSVDGRPPAFRRLRELMLDGEVGVSLFFVLSGALLSLPFWRRYLAGQPPPSLSDYARRRTARILPGYYLALGVSFAAGQWLAGDAPSPWLRLAAGATMIAPYHYLSFFPAELNAPLWSIGLEVTCYLVLPFLLLVSRAIKRRPALLAVTGAYVAVMCWIDIYWLVIPEFSPGVARFGLLDVFCFLGMSGVFAAAFLLRLKGHSLIAEKDPRLEESLVFESA